MRSGVSELRRPIRWGMVGGGAASDIGYNHRSPALCDQNFHLLAGASMWTPSAAETSALSNLRYADVEAGLDGVRWVQACVRSADAGGVWVDYI